MLKKGLAGVIILLFIVAGIIPSSVGIYEKKQSPKDDKTSSMVFNPRGDILYVGGSGPNNYTKIQDAIDAASNEDTVFVYDYSSPYYENVVVDKSIDLIGENRETTVIDGSETGDVVYISSDWVNVTGFTLQNSGDDWLKACVHILSSNNTVSDCKIINEHQEGIRVGGYDYEYTISDNNVIFDCRIVNCGIVMEAFGIYSGQSNNNLVMGNEISNGGIKIGSYSSEWTGEINNSQIIGNEISNAGITLLSNNSQVIGNEISGLGGQSYGLDLRGACFNLIKDNKIHDKADTWAVYLYEHSDGNDFINNTIFDNHEGVFSSESNASYFENNTIVDNEYRDILFVDYFYNTTLLNNDMDNGIYIIYEADRVPSDPTYYGGVDGNILTGNTVNGKPLIYREDESSTTIESEPAGQIILVNCDNVTVDAIDLSNTLIGLELIDSTDCVLSNNTFCNNIFQGVFLLNSHYNMIQDNTLSDMPRGEWVSPEAIHLKYSNTTNISHNTFSNCYFGICIECSFSTTIYMNTFENCVYDIRDMTNPKSINRVKPLNNGYEPSHIIKNNFMGLTLFKKFQVYDPSISFITWKNNYWGRFRILPKLLLGVDSGGKLVQLKVDWNPARKPYEV